ncbi:beta-agarase [bacterium]|nr:beta-agarase [bacterium]
MKQIRRLILATVGLAAFCGSAFAAYFSTGQADGRWWLLDPDGARFFSLGVCVVDPSGYYAPDLGYSPYQQNILAIYGDEAAWAETTRDRLQTWGFNTIGSWGKVSLFENDMPYTVNLGLADANWQYGEVTDYFDPGWLDFVDTRVAQQVTPRAADENLVGWFLDNELRWGPDWRSVKDLFAEYFAFPETAAGKIALVDFLVDRYGGDVAAFNSAWGMSLTSFDDLLPMTDTTPMSLQSPMKEDRVAFGALVADKFFMETTDRIRAADPNHLILGVRFVSWAISKAIVEASAPYVDVLSLNHYTVYPFYEPLLDGIASLFSWASPHDEWAEFHALTGLPVMVSEFNVRAYDSGLPNTNPYDWFFYTVDTQAERADFYEGFARAAFESAHVVGIHWFSYMDEPAEGRFDGENGNTGIVNEQDEPYDLLVTRMAETNADALVWPPAGDDDDSADDDATDDDVTDDDATDDDATDDDATDDDATDDDAMDDDADDDVMDDDTDDDADDDIDDDGDLPGDDDSVSGEADDDAVPAGDDDDDGGCGC